MGPLAPPLSSLRRIVAVEAIRSVGIPAPGAPQGVSCQIRYFLTSSAAPGERIAEAVVLPVKSQL